MVRVVAHRGASIDFADNSRASLLHALELGAHMIEYDVRETRDGHLVLFHDKKFRGKLISAWKRKSLERTLGHSLLILQDANDMCSQGQMIEIKETGYTDRVLDIVHANKEHTIIISFHDEVVEVAHRAGFKTGLLVSRDIDSVPTRLAQTGADYLAIRKDKLKHLPIVQVPLIVWTVNDALEMILLSQNPKITAIVTDNPALAIRKLY